MNVFKLIEDNKLQLHGDIEYFAHLVAEAEREKVAQWMIERSFATGHGDSIEDLLQELEWQVKEQEREACAKVVEEWLHGDWHNQGIVAAAMIRARGEK